jgi:hypothetical protein
LLRIAAGSAIAVIAACGLQERADFLLGRECDPLDSKSCDSGQSCLPHTIIAGRFSDYRCRDRSSFDPIEGREAPLAYCDGQMIKCPGDLVCNADRVRQDSTARPLVCTLPNSMFAPPPLDGGS